MTHKIRKSEYTLCFEMLHVLFEGRGLRINELKFLIKEKIISSDFFPIFFHQNHESGTGSAMT
jgi:hypothetical protein